MLMLSGAVLTLEPAPKLVTDDMVKQMRRSVIVDVAVDRCGVIETKDCATTHTSLFTKNMACSTHAAANIPGAVARTSTIALTHVTSMSERFGLTKVS